MQPAGHYKKISLPPDELISVFSCFSWILLAAKLDLLLLFLSDILISFLFCFYTRMFSDSDFKTESQNNKLVQETEKEPV